MSEISCILSYDMRIVGAIVPVIMVVSAHLRYAYAVASALYGVKHVLWNDFMLQV